jgi:transcriptional regulator with XRE-family HTH domain
VTELDLIPQPDFGERLRRLRQQRGLKQSDLTGESLSASYVSRIESGTRAVTPHIAHLLAKRLGVDITVFQGNREAVLADLLVQAQQALLSGDYATVVRTLETALEKAPRLSLALEWQIRQSMCTALSHLGRLTAWRRHQTRLVALATESDSPRLLVSAYTGLSNCLRFNGEIDGARTAARWAVDRARDQDVPETPRVMAMIALIASEAEAGRSSEAASYADELLNTIGPETPPSLRAKVLWAAASARFGREGFDETMALLRRAMTELPCGEDLVTWARLRLAAVSLSYRAGQPIDTDTSASFTMASQVLRLTGIPIYQAQLDLLEAELAFGERRFEDVEALCRSALAQTNLLSFRDREQARILEARAMGHRGHPDRAIDSLRDVAQQLDDAGAKDLSAEAWRLVAEFALMPRDRED